MKWFASIFFGTLFFARATAARAGEQGFLTCSGLDCNLCDAIEMINLITEWTIGIAVLIAIYLMVVAGFRLVTSGGDRSAYERAKKLLFNAIIGFLIIMAAWTIIDTLLKLVATDSVQEMTFGVWNEIDCGGQTNQSTDMPAVINLDIDFDIPLGFYEDTDDLDGQDYIDQGMMIVQCNLSQGAPSVDTCAAWCESRYPGSVLRSSDRLGYSGGAEYCILPVAPPPLPPVGSVGCGASTCVPMSVPCTNGCSIAPDLVDRINAFHAAAGVDGARVTEAMPPSRQHRSACHNNGTCIDYSKAGGMNAAEVQSVINAARANGLRPVYEVQTQAQKDALVSGGVNAGDIIVLGSWISAPHFSIYGN